jgi:rsbT antagonist protein RsbS
MEVPILKQGPLLITTIQNALTDSDLLKLKDNLVGLAGRHRSRGVIIDVAALEVMDSFMSMMLRNITQVLKLRGADTIVIGIQPDVAFAMVQLGLNLEGLEAALDLEEAIAILDGRFKEARSNVR